jgi:hypothetical protein
VAGGAAREKRPGKNLVEGEIEMPDIIFIALALAFFALGFLYVRFCERV